MSVPGMSQPPPDLLRHLGQALALVRLPRAGLVVDFDGTISEIAPTPDAAVVHPRCASALAKLSRRLALVSVVSGRAASDIQARVGLDGVLYVGNHGAEYLLDGRLQVEHAALAYRERLLGVLGHLRAAVDTPGLVWQDKVLSASVHYRLAPDAGEARRALEAALKAAPGARDLEVFWGKLVLELRAPVGLDKGYAIRKMAREYRLDSVIFLGDDTTDLDAMRAVKALREQGQSAGLAVAVAHRDTSAQLLETADLRLDGVPAVAEFLERLESATGSAATG